MPFDGDVIDAIYNLRNVYNGDAYNASTNPGGMGEGGHRQNFEPALEAVGLTGEAVGSAADTVQTQSDDVAVRSTEFRSRFLGASATPPTQDGNGDPVADGAIYWDSSTDTLRVRSNGQWEAPAAAATDYVPASTGGTFTGAVTASGGVNGNLTGTVTGDVTGNVTGNADTATKLETGRDISISGTGITGSNGVFDGTADLALTVNVNDDGHTHSFGNLGLGTIASQDADGVAITGGTLAGVTLTNATLDEAPLGETTRSTAKVTTLDANGAVTFGTTLGVTGAATLSSTLGVTDTATFTAQSVHPAGVNTNLIQGADGTLILNADAGDSVEIQVAGTKVAEVTPDGDVIAERYLTSAAAPYWQIYVSDNPIGNPATYDETHFTRVDASPYAGDCYDDTTGEILIQADGFYVFFVNFKSANGSFGTSVRITKFNDGTDAFDIVLATSGTSIGASELKYLGRFVAGDRLRLERPSSQILATGAQDSGWYGYRTA